MKTRPFLILCGLVALLGATVARAEPASGLRAAEVLPGWRTAHGVHFAAIALTLAPGWKTYWRAPGDAGIPPHFDWQGSDNLAGVVVHWPRPIVFDLNGMRSIGYSRAVVLPLEVTPRDPARPVTLRGRIDMGVCEEICVPLSVDIAATLPAASSGAAAGTGVGVDPRIATALADVPAPAAQHGLVNLSCEVSPAGRGLTLTARINIPALGPTETAVIEAAGKDLWVSETRAERKAEGLVAVSEVYPTGRAPVSIDRGQITITVLSGDQAVEMQGCPAP